MKRPAVDVAVCQPLIVPGRVADNAEAIRLMALEAHEQGARLAVFGECSLTGYDFRGYGIDAALTVDDPRIARLHRQARNAGLGLVVGLFERDGGRLFNTALTLLPDGRVIVQRKKCLTGYERGAGLAPLDDGYHAFDFDGVRLGTLVCADAGDEEPYDTYRRERCDATVIITAGLGRLDQGYTLDRLGDPDTRAGYERWMREVGSVEPSLESVRKAGMGQAACNLATYDVRSDCFHCGSGSVVDHDGTVGCMVPGEFIVERLTPRFAVGRLSAKPRPVVRPPEPAAATGARA